MAVALQLTARALGLAAGDVVPVLDQVFRGPPGQRLTVSVGLRAPWRPSWTRRALPGSAPHAEKPKRLTTLVDASSPMRRAAVGVR